jgi:SAM-dependent methyltransferase
MTRSEPPICNYEGSDYRTRFWDGQGREYEDRVERIALRRLLPATGATLLDIGAGFGRYANEFGGYERVVLLDYSRSLLEEAHALLGDDPRFLYVIANWYEMPFVAGLFNTMVQIRTIHHAADVPALFQELARIARPGGRYILEFANKQNLKAILRYLMGRQEWSPFDLEPVEFVELNYDFHPRWIRQQLAHAGFRPGQMLTVSHYRLPLLKRLFPTSLLVALDQLAQHSGNWWQMSPSVFVASQHPAGTPAAAGRFFACPHCRTPLGEARDGRLVCSQESCGRHWRVENGLYDFKEPIAPAS